MSLKLNGFGALLGRYVEVTKLAWRQRRQMEHEPRKAHELQFLPAALALQETPVSPVPRVTMWLLIGFASIAIIWAVLGRIDVVATAQGKVVPNDRIKTMQPFETATVKRILVTDGQKVRMGEVLIELDGTVAHADAQRLHSELIAAELLIARNQAMLDFIEQRKNVSMIVPDRVAASADAIRQAQRLFSGQIAEYQARIARIDAEIRRREAEMRSTTALVNKLQQIVPIARQRAEDFRQLAEKNFISRHGYLEREQVRIEQEADLANQQSRRREIEAALSEGLAQRKALIAETRRTILDEMHSADRQRSVLIQELVKADSRHGLMKITAPVDGTVQQLAVHTVGGVVTPAQPLMVIVPSDNPLEVEAFIENKDIGFIREGQEAELKVQTFLFTRYGTIPAKVVSISHDAIQDERLGLVYSARIRMERSTMLIDGTEIKLTPGMAVSVEIKTGTRRLIEYFLSPLLQHAGESMRER